MEESNNITGLKGSEKYALMACLLGKLENAGIQDGTYPEIKESKDGLITFSVMKSKVKMDELERIKNRLSGVELSIAHGNKYSFRIVIEGNKQLFLNFLAQSRMSSPTR